MSIPLEQLNQNENCRLSWNHSHADHILNDFFVHHNSKQKYKKLLFHIKTKGIKEMYFTSKGFEKKVWPV